MLHQYSDGGRADAGYRGVAGDCVTRAIAIVTGLPYKQVYDAINRGANTELKRSDYGIKSSARHGVYTQRAWFKRYMRRLGFTWTACKKEARLSAGTIPSGRHVVSIHKHYTAVVDDVIYDTYNCSKTKNGRSRIYGYWTLVSKP